MSTSAQSVSPVAAPESFRLASSTFTTYTTAFPTYDALVDSNTAPATATANGSYIFDRPSGESLALRFLGVGSDNNTVNYLVIVWDRIIDASPSVEQWTPSVLCTGVATLSAKTGVASGNILAATVRYADTITITADRSMGPLFCRVMAGSAGDNSAATLVCPLPKCAKVEVRLEMGTATSGNVLYRGQHE